MKSFLSLCLALFLLCSCGNTKKKFDEKTYEQNKESLADKEKKNPIDFLEVSGNDRRNWLGQTVIKGSVHNKASVIAYRDIRIKMLFFNKEGKLVANHEDVYEETLLPNNSMKFKARYGTPRGTDSVALSVMSAAVAEPQEAKTK